MKNNYIINKDFYIKDDLSSFLLYYDYFSQGLSQLNRYTDSPFIRKIFHHLLRGFILLTFYLKIYKYIYKSISLDENALIIIKRKGGWANTLKVFNKGKKLKVLKKSFNKDSYTREQNFYNKYKDNTTRIQLISHTFLPDNFIEMDFVKAKTLQRLINEGEINFDQALNHFEIIREEIEEMYNTKSFVHGDLWLTNIFINNKGYYLIDYTDAHNETIEYDLYIFLLSLLSSFKNYGTNREDPDFYSKKRETISKLLSISVEKIIDLENRYKSFRMKKLGDN